MGRRCCGVSVWAKPDSDSRLCSVAPSASVKGGVTGTGNDAVEHAVRTTDIPTIMPMCRPLLIRPTLWVWIVMKERNQSVLCWLRSDSF